MLVGQVVPQMGLLDRWEFTGGNFNSGNGVVPNNIVNQPVPTTDRCGLPGNAMHFNGVSSYLEYTMPPSVLLPFGAIARSVSFWMRSANTATGIAAVESIFHYGDNNGQGGSFQICHNYCDQGVGLDVSNQAFIANNTCINDNDWHHVVAVFNDCRKSGNCAYSFMEVYIDGVLTPVGCNQAGLTQVLNTVLNCNITIGKDACNNTRFFDGDLDDFYFYNRALTVNEIQGLFTTGCNFNISGNWCINSAMAFWTPPVASAINYIWTLPNGWTFTPNTNQNTNGIFVNVGPQPGPAVLQVSITTPCSVITRTLNVNAISIGLSVSNATLCTSASNSIQISANVSSTVVPPVWYNWLGVGIGQTQNVSPTVPTTYTVIAFNSSTGCTETATMQVVPVATCCTSFLMGGTPTLGLSSLTAPGSLNGSVFIDQDLTIGGNGNFVFNGGNFVIRSGVKITLLPNVNLVLSETHLSSCGEYLWKGIIVNDGANVTSSVGPNNLPSLIEDAEVAIDVSGVTSNHAVPLLDLDGVIFNKNYIGIRIQNSTEPNIQIKVRSCVFTSRNLYFTYSSWPGTSTNSPDLRYSSTLNTNLGAPFLSQAVLYSWPYVGIKNPIPPTFIPASTLPAYLNLMQYNSRAGIQIKTIVPGSNNTTPGVDIMAWASPAPNQFNLFDYMNIGIEVTDASLTTINNYFQKAPWGSFSAGSGIVHTITNGMNARLNLSPGTNAQAGTGNRFWDLESPGTRAVYAYDVLEVDIQNATFRNKFSTPFYYNNTLNTFCLGPNNVGDANIFLSTNRFDKYNISNNQFNNITGGICMLLNHAGPYNVNSSPGNGIYAGSLKILQNYFGPEISSSTPVATNHINFMPIYISGISNVTWNIASSQNLIQSNNLNRCQHGVMVDDMVGYPIEISHNDISMLNYQPASLLCPQKGISVINSVGNKVVKNNTIRSNGLSSDRSSCFYGKNNFSLVVKCNMAYDAFIGYDFECTNATWEGNVMFNLQRGLNLSSAVTPMPGCPYAGIGQQGSPSQSSGNLWLGNWPSGTFHTFVTGSALNSPLYVDGSPLTNHGLNPIYQGSLPYGTANTLFYVSNPYNGCVPQMFPNIPYYRLAGTTGIQNTELPTSKSIGIYPNPSSGKINIDLTGAENEYIIGVRVINLQGQEVLIRNYSDQSTSVELLLQDYKNGLYFVEVTTNSETIRSKVIISR